MAPASDVNITYLPGLLHATGILKLSCYCFESIKEF